MYRFQGRQLVKTALTICIGSLVVNIIYVSFPGKRAANTNDFQILNSLTERQERFSINKSEGNALYNVRHTENTTHKDLHQSSIFQSSSRNENSSTHSKEQNFSNEPTLKTKINENNQEDVRKTKRYFQTSTAPLEKHSQQVPSEKKTQEKPKGSFGEGQNSSHSPEVAIHHMSPLEKQKILDKVDNFHEDILNNEILNLDDVTSAGNRSDCPDRSPLIVGELAGDLNNVTKDELVKLFPKMEPGGRLRPSDCVPRQRLAIILPYRNRYPHLHITLHNLIPILHRQQADVTFFVVEQALPSTFNKGALFNAGFIEANKLGNFDCFILHDVDLIPLNDFNLYRCDSNPRHYAVSIDKYSFQLYYSTHFGGVVGCSREQYLKVNGNSNLYIGWGGEDDDFRRRLVNKNFTIQRYPLQIARYSMIKHQRDKGNEINPLRSTILNSATKRQDIDGLNTVRYKVLNITFEHLYTWITVFINNTEILQTAPAMTLADVKDAKKKWLAEMANKKKKQQLNNETISSSPHS